MVVDSFKKCCIANAMDGTVDDMLWYANNKKEMSDNSNDKCLEKK